MAGSNEYHIYLHLDELTDESAMAGTTGSTAAANPATDAAAASASKVAKAATKLVSFAAVASTADKIVSYNINSVSLRTGATEYEQRLNASYSLGKEIIGAGMALGAGAIFGGPAGFAVALIGIAASGVNKLISLEQNRETLRLEQSLENISIGMQNMRAGIAGRRARDQ